MLRHGLKTSSEALPGSSLEMQNHRPHPRLTESGFERGQDFMLTSPGVTLTELNLKSSASGALSLVDECRKTRKQMFTI